MQLVHQFLHSSAEQYPAKPAILCDGRPLTYAELSAHTDRISEALLAMGLQRGERVLIHLQNRIDLLTTLYGVMQSGGIAVPIPGNAPADAIAEISADCTPAFIVTGSDELPDTLPGHRLGNSTLLSIEKLRQGPDPQAQTGAGDKRKNHLSTDDGALILYTSTPAGTRKAVYYTHRNIVQATLNVLQFSKIDASIAELVSAPITQLFALGRITAILFVAGTAMLLDEKHDSVLDRLRNGEGNSFAVRADGLDRFLGPADGSARRIGHAIRFIALRGSSVTLHQRRKMLELFPHARICMEYGMAEGMYNTCLEFHSERKKLETAGRRLPSVELAIADDQSKHLGRGLTGEILLRGDHMMSGYWRENAIHKDGFTEDKWFRTGDMGYIDKDGYLHILGRKDELINMRGVLISPLEVEEKIHEAYPEYEICVVGIPDPVGAVGEIPVLCYIPRGGKTIIPSELSHALAGLLDQNKIPRIVYRVHEFPRFENRILRRELRQQLLAGAERIAQNVS